MSWFSDCVVLNIHTGGDQRSAGVQVAEGSAQLHPLGGRSGVPGGREAGGCSVQLPGGVV